MKKLDYLGFRGLLRLERVAAGGRRFFARRCARHESERLADLDRVRGVGEDEIARRKNNGDYMPF